MLGKFRRFCAPIIMVVLLAVGNPAGAHNDEGRWVDAGPWNGLLDCESSPTDTRGPLAPRHHPRKRAAEVRVDQISYTHDYGAFQFQRATWDSVAALRGRERFVGVDPRTTSLASQLRQAEWLRTNVSISQWSCGYRYGDGTGPVWVTAEWKLPRRPERCAANLNEKWNLTEAQARSVCDD